MSSLFLLDCNLCKLAAHNSFGFLNIILFDLFSKFANNWFRPP